MEISEDKIKKFLAIDISDGDGSGSGSVFGHGLGYGHGSGFGFVFGDGCGYGSGSGQGLILGCGDGYGYGSDSGIGSGSGLKEIDGKKIYIVDDTQTIFISIRDNVAKGYIVQSDLQLKPCFIVKENNKFAHGDTLRDAFTSLQEKLYDDSTEEERIEAFKKKFPEYDVKYDNRDLFAYHHVLTGSCRMGRESFVADRGLSLDGKTSVREFVELTRNAYGGDIIQKLPSAYEVDFSS